MRKGSVAMSWNFQDRFGWYKEAYKCNVCEAIVTIDNSETDISKLVCTNCVISHQEYINVAETAKYLGAELDGAYKELNSVIEDQSAIIAEQLLTIKALNSALGGEDTCTTDNLIRICRMEETIAQLQADNAKLRDALVFECGGRCNAEHNPCNAREVLQALGETK